MTRRLLPLLLLAAVTLAVVLVVVGGGDGDDAGAGLRKVSEPSVGLAFSHPEDWTRSGDARAITLRSPEGSVVLTIASPVAGRAPERVKSALRRALRRRYAPARVVRESPAPLGDRTATSFELTGRSGPNRIRALALVDDTPFRTYAVTLVTPAQPLQRSLEQVKALLRTVRLSKPVGS